MFETQAFLNDHFGTHERLICLLSAYGFPSPSHWTADKWWRRGSVPSAWFALLLVVLELERGEAVSLSYYCGAIRS